MADIKLRDVLFEIFRKDVKANLYTSLTEGKTTLCEFRKLLIMVNSPDEEAVQLASELIQQKLNGPTTE